MPGPEPEVMTVGMWIVLVVFSIIGASLSCLRRGATLKVAAYHIGLAAFVGPLFAFIYHFMWPNSFTVYLGAAITGFTGLLIFGIAVMFEKTSGRIEKIDPMKIFPHTAILTPEEPPPAPAVPPPAATKGEGPCSK